LVTDADVVASLSGHDAERAPVGTAANVELQRSMKATLDPLAGEQRAR
jgi:hypothetical protein